MIRVFLTEAEYEGYAGLERHVVDGLREVLIWPGWLGSAGLTLLTTIVRRIDPVTRVVELTNEEVELCQRYGGELSPADTAMAVRFRMLYAAAQRSAA